MQNDIEITLLDSVPDENATLAWGNRDHDATVLSPILLDELGFPAYLPPVLGIEDKLQADARDREVRQRPAHNLFPVLPFSAVPHAIRNVRERVAGKGLEILVSTHSSIKTPYGTELPVAKILYQDVTDEYGIIVLPESQEAKQFLQGCYETLDGQRIIEELPIFGNVQPAEGLYFSREEVQSLEGGKVIPVKKIGTGGQCLLFIGWDTEAKQSGVYNFARLSKNFDGPVLLRKEESIWRGLSGKDYLLQPLTTIRQWKDVAGIRQYFLGEGDFDPEFYFVTEHCEGMLGDLSIWFKGRMDEAFTRLDDAVTEALTTMHKNDLTHRDVDPKNIYVKLRELSGGFFPEPIVGDAGITLRYVEQRVVQSYSGTPSGLEPENPLALLYAALYMGNPKFGWLDDEEDADRFAKAVMGSHFVRKSLQTPLSQIAQGKRTGLSIEDIFDERVDIWEEDGMILITKDEVTTSVPLKELRPNFENGPFTTDEAVYAKAVGIHLRQNEGNLYIGKADYLNLVIGIVDRGNVKALLRLPQAHRDELALIRAAHAVNKVGFSPWVFDYLMDSLAPRIDRHHDEEVVTTNESGEGPRRSICRKRLWARDEDMKFNLPSWENHTMEERTRAIAAMSLAILDQIESADDDKEIYGKRRLCGTKFILGQPMPQVMAKRLEVNTYSHLQGGEIENEYCLYLTEPAEWVVPLAGLAFSQKAETDYAKWYFGRLRLELELSAAVHSMCMANLCHIATQSGKGREIAALAQPVKLALHTYWNLLARGEVDNPWPGRLEYQGTPIQEFTLYLIQQQQLGAELANNSNYEADFVDLKLSELYAEGIKYRTDPKQLGMDKLRKELQGFV